MKVTLEELQVLRSTLIAHRLEHEKLVTQMQMLRQNCQELRAQIASTTRAGRTKRSEMSSEGEAGLLMATA